MSGVNLSNQISGLASGMDTEKIVSDMMRVKRIPLDKLEQAKTINSWKTDAYREINTKIASFRDAMQDLRLQGTFNAQKVTSSDARLEVSMAGTSTLANFTISEAQLAKPATRSAVSFDTKIVIGAKPIDAIGAFSSIAFTLNNIDIDIAVTNTTTFDDVIAQINTKSTETGVKVANVGGSLVFTTTEAGAYKSITITGSNTAGSQLNIANGTTISPSDPPDPTAVPQFTDGTYFSKGADAEQGFVVINGTKINVSNNTFTFDGVQIKLKQDIPAKSAVGVSIAADTDKLFDKLKTFVDKYNDLIKDINSKLSETKKRDFPPLTDAQRKDMKEADIKLWEDKAKSGLLTNDPALRQFLTQLRTSISESVQTAGINTSFDSLSEIGITTSTNYQDNGKLTLDESKLKSLLTSNLIDIQKMFSNRFDTTVVADTTVTSSIKYKNSGFAIRVYDRIADTLSRLGVIAGAPGTISINSDMAKAATSLTDRMTKAQDRLDSQEQALWKRFNAMESALQRLNTQSSWLSQQLGQ
jgi:flagellar hook-associated protein 2